MALRVPAVNLLGPAAFLLLAAPLLIWGAGTQSYEAPRWAAIYVLTAVLAGAWIWRLASEGHEAGRWGWLWLPVAWAAASLAWTPDPVTGLGQILHMAMFAVLAGAVWRMPELDRPWLFAAMAGAASALFWPSYEGGYGNENFQSHALLLFLPWLAAGWWMLGRTLSAVCFVLILATLVYLVGFNESRIEFFVALAVAAAALWRSGRRDLALGVAAVPILFAWAWGPESVALSLRERVEMGWNTLAMWWDAPVFGHGVGSFNYLYPLYQEAHSWLLPGTMMDAPALMVGAAHNEYAQGMAELGAVGLAAFLVPLALIWRPGRGVVHNAAWWSVLILAALSVLDFPLQKPVPVLVGAVSAGVLLRSFRGGRIRWAPCLAALLMVAACAAMTPQRWIGAAYAQAARVQSETNSSEAFVLGMNAVRRWPFDPVPRVQVTISFARWFDQAPPNMRFDPALVNTAFGYGLRASPYLPAIGVLQIGHWVSRGDAEARREDIEAILARLTERNAMQPEVWLAEAVWAATNGETERAERALDRIEDTPRGFRMAPYVENIERMLER